MMMTSTPGPVGACAFVVFGAMGDLTKRKLLPSLYNLRANGLLPKNVAIVGVARRPLDNASYRDYATSALREYATRPVEDEVWKDYVDRIHYVKGDFEDPATYQGVAVAMEHAAKTGTAPAATPSSTWPPLPTSSARSSAAWGRPGSPGRTGAGGG